MKTVDITFKKAEVTNFQPREGTVEFRVVFNDGKDKAVQRNCVIADPDVLAKDVLSEIRKKEKEMHRTLNLDDDPLASTVLIRIKGDEESIEETLTKFLSSIRERIKSAKLSRVSYYDMERKVKGFSVNF